MKIWMRVVGLLAMMICGAVGARAQAHRVLVLGDDEAVPVADGLKAKIKASGRYAVTEKLAEAERDPQHKHRHRNAAQAWAFLAKRLREADTTWERIHLARAKCGKLDV